MAGRLPRVTGATGSVDTAGEGGFYTPTIFQAGDTGTAQTQVTSNNQVQVTQFVLPFRAVVGQLTFEVTTASASGLFGVGLYDKDKNLLLKSLGISTTAAEFKTESLASSVTLEPGVYFVAFTVDNTTARSRTNVSGTMRTFPNEAGNIRNGVAANAGSSGVLPATLGAITGHPSASRKDFL